MNIGLLLKKNINDYKKEALYPILNDTAFDIKVAIIDKRPKQNIIKKISKNYKRGRGGYMIVMAFQKLLKRKKNSTNTYDFLSKYNIDTIDTEKIYSDQIIKKIKKYKLDVLILVNGFGIIKNPILDISPYGIIAYHHGDMRKYRGMPPGFWELYNNEKKMGITVQKLDKKLDAGIPIIEKSVEINKNETISSLMLKARKQSQNMLYESLKKLESDSFKFNPITELGNVYTLPNLRQWVLLKIKLLYRQFI